MKAQFKYSFLAGQKLRYPVFAVSLLFFLTFGVLGSLGLLPFAAHVTAVSLGGVAIAVMLTVNIIGDVAIARRMFSAPDAYLHALTPAPRRKILLASFITVLILDAVTLTAVITGEVWLSLNMAGSGLWSAVWDAVRNNITASEFMFGVWLLLLGMAAYLLLWSVILFSVTAKKSVFFKIPASGLLSFLLACACFYAFSLLQLVLAPFGTVERWGVFITLYVPSNFPVMALSLLVTLAEIAVLFTLTSKLMERKMNI